MTAETNRRLYFVSHGIFFHVFFINRRRRPPEKKYNNKNSDGKLTWAFLLASFPSSVGNPNIYICIYVQKEALNHTRNYRGAKIKTFFNDSNFSLTILHKPNYLDWRIYFFPPKSSNELYGGNIIKTMTDFLNNYIRWFVIRSSFKYLSTLKRCIY